jgi:hypothetical protein
MTRKDFILIAEALRVVHHNAKLASVDSDNQAARLSGVLEASSEIADALQRDNSRFNREHFLAVVRGERELMSRPSRNGVRS